MTANEKIKLGVIFGGQSSEYEISCVSAAAVLSHLDPEKYEVTKIAILLDGRWFVYTGPDSRIADRSFKDDTENLVPAVLSPCTAHHGLMYIDKKAGTYRIERLDCLLPILHGENGEDGNMQGLMTLSGVPYVGPRTRSAAVTMDKAMTKLSVGAQKIRQAPHVLIYYNDYKQHDHRPLVDFVSKQIGYPVFVKPSNAGSSVGVSKVNSREELENAIEIAAKVDNKVLIEQYIKGKEVEVALLERYVDGKKKLIASTCGEIRPSGDFYDYNSKYVDDKSECLAPAEIPESTARELREAAKRIFRATDCSGLARADFFVDGEKFVFNEINAIPGFTSISMFPMLFRFDGIEFGELVDILVETAMKDAEQ